ncbi:hypothetical protein K501DRAFT_174000 [Backusella circina FSU 941]|nr:hypothetical protein K501DRAFT_174000 [Backusella circina FSU 941]
MTVLIRQLRAFITETPLRVKRSNSNNKKSKRKLSVTICQDPPSVIYFERDTLEDSFECIFDPEVCHDDEKDHPDLLHIKKCSYRKGDLKPWQKPPYSSNTSSLLNRLKSPFKNVLPVHPTVA